MRGCFHSQVRGAYLRTRSASELLTLLEVGGLDFVHHSLGTFGSGLPSPWYVARYSWDIQVEPRLGFRPAETGLIEVRTGLVLTGRLHQ